LAPDVREPGPPVESAASESLPLIDLQAVDKAFGSGVHALQGLSMQVRAGEFVALLGPSGCGKSTVLRLVAGLDAPTAGRVTAPALATRRGGADRTDTAYVFQEPTLMPWARVDDNVALPLRLQGLPRDEGRRRSADVLARVGLSGFERAWPAQLSGGMKMRASIARALVTSPQVLLMDEPFAALDDLTRQRLNLELLQWARAQRLTVLFVTHSVSEAVFLADRVVVMSPRPGRVVAQLDVPAPADRDAAFRHDARFHATVRKLSEALMQAVGDEA